MSPAVTCPLVVVFLGLLACADSNDGPPVSTQPFTGQPVDRAFASESPDGAANLPLPPLPSRCTTVVTIPYTPFTVAAPTQFPDDIFTVPDATSATGRRINITPTDFAWAMYPPEAVPNLFDGLNALSGFSLSGEIFFELSAAVPQGAKAPKLDPSRIYFIRLDKASPPIRFSAKFGQNGHAIVIRPLFPLSPGGRYAVLMTRGVLGSGHTCVNTSASFYERLNDPSSHPRLDDHRADLLTALSQAAVGTDQTVAATVFTTQDDAGAMERAAMAIEQNDYQWLDDVRCEMSEHYRKCVAQFVAHDYRGPAGTVEGTPSAPWTLTVNLWFPLDSQGPQPVIMYGHGINGGRDEGDYFARHFAKLGYVIIATDAMRHGDHPTRDPDSQLTALDVLGVSILDLRIDPVQLRANFNQTILDYLQLLRLIRQNPDFDGDGRDDLETETFVYFGVSLGGMLGSGFSAFAKDLDAVTLSVPGGHLVKFVTDMEAIQDARILLETIFGDARSLERTLAIAQSIVDAADPVTYAPKVFTPQRIEARDIPSLLMAVSAFDSTVPPSTGQALARALGLPHLTPIAEPVEGLVSDSTPARNNGHHEGHTMGFFQFDRISTRSGNIELSDHASTPKSEEGRYQVRAFLQSVLDGGGVLIVDPYEALQTPALSTTLETP
ncbi:MAG: hypothetical protein VX589_01940 [Myxococcota bacterium]|nr:hypothetical protein [Myxococcota bacterium]